jgi:pre-mRNA-splicing factor SYF2
LTYYQNEARKENEQAMVVEKKRMEPCGESRGLSKEKRLEDRKKNTRRLLDSNGLEYVEVMYA